MDLVGFVNQHLTASDLFAIAFVLNTIVQALPPITTEDGKFYQFFFRFMHAAAQNWQMMVKEPKKAEGETFKASVDAEVDRRISLARAENPELDKEMAAVNPTQPRP